MLRRIAAYSFFAAGVLVIVFFRGYEGRLIPHPVLFWILGFVLLVTGIFIMANASSRKQQRERMQAASAITDLVQNGIPLTINLSACNIKDHSYLTMPEQADGTGFPEGISDMERYTPARQQEVHQSVVVCNCVYKGKERQFVSDVIGKDRATLIFLLDNQKETVVYVDKDNPERYYFDMDFLRQ